MLADCDLRRQSRRHGRIWHGNQFWAYLGTQFGAIIHYLQLCVWPHPLVFDYGSNIAHSFWGIVPYAIVVVLLGAATMAALWHWPKVGFLGAWFFTILAPTSSVVPVTTQTIAEHRMYLPLAAVLTGLVVGGGLVGQRLVRHSTISLRTWRLAGWRLSGIGRHCLWNPHILAHRRLPKPAGVWTDAAAKVPRNVGPTTMLARLGPVSAAAEEAIPRFEKAVDLDPDYAAAHVNLGVALDGRGQSTGQSPITTGRWKSEPTLELAHNNLGVSLAKRPNGPGYRRISRRPSRSIQGMRKPMATRVGSSRPRPGGRGHSQVSDGSRPCRATGRTRFGRHPTRAN